MHVVLGDGEMTRRELTETLKDLWKADEEDSQTFWFLIQGKSEPTDTDKALVGWLEKNALYYEVVTDDAESMSDVYAEPQETHIAKKLSQKVVALLQSRPEDEEPAEILALFVDVNDTSAAEDRWLNGVIVAAQDAGFKTRALNDGMVDIDLNEEASEAEPEPAAKPTKKAATKKAAAPKAEAVEEEPTPAVASRVPLRAELEEMEPSAVKEIAATMGIVLPPRTRVTTYIDHILGEAKVTPAAEVEEAVEEAVEEPMVATNGHVDVNDNLAREVADILWKRLAKALTAD